MNSDFHKKVCRQLTYFATKDTQAAELTALSNYAIDCAHQNGYMKCGQKRAVTSKHDHLIKYILANDTTREKILCYHATPANKKKGEYKVKIYSKKHMVLFEEARCAYIDKNYEALGVMLHSIFDHYSHEGFSFRLHPENNVSGLIVNGKPLEWYNKVWVWGWKKPLLHAEALGHPDDYETEWFAPGRHSEPKKNWVYFEACVKDVLQLVFGIGQAWKHSKDIIRIGRTSEMKCDVQEFLRVSPKWHKEARSVRTNILLS